MAFSVVKFIKGILISEENTLTPKEIEILPGGTSGTKTTIQAAQTANRTLTLPDATDTLVSSSASQTLSNKSIDADTNTITNIDNADIKTGANIDRNKLASGTASHVLINDGSGILSSEAQLDKTRGGTGVSSTATFPTSGVVVTESATQTLTNKTIDASQNTISNIDVTSTNLASATLLNEATTNTDSTVNIATGTGNNVINIGGANSTVNFTGTVNNNNVTNLNVTDKLITINDGGGAGSGGNSGFEIEENGVATGSVQTSADRNSYEFKAPNTAGIATLTPGSSSDTILLSAASQSITNKDIDGGIASNSRRITLPKDSLTNITALTRKQGTLIYSTTDNKIYFDDGTSLIQLSTSSGSGNLSVNTVSSNTTITTLYDLVLVDTSSGDVTITLPTAVGNQGKVFQIFKTASANKIIIDGNGSQTIDEELTQEVYVKLTNIPICSDGANWIIL